jgi:hypothetical protein
VAQGGATEGATSFSARCDLLEVHVVRVLRRRLEGVRAAVGAGVVGLPSELLADRFVPVDLHPAYGVGRSAPGGQPEQRGEDHKSQNVEREYDQVYEI